MFIERINVPFPEENIFQYIKITLVIKIARDHNFKALVLKLNVSTLKIITALDNYA